MISGLKAAGVTLDRKMLADIAVNEPESFTSLAKQAEQARPKVLKTPARGASKAARPAKAERVNRSAPASA